MEVTFLVSLHYLSITESLGRGDKINDSTFISNDTSLIDELIPEELVPGIGLMEIESLKNNGVFVYSKEEISDDANPKDYLLNKLLMVQSLISFIWLFKDNNIDCEQGFIFYTLNNCLTAKSNFLARVATMATGTQENTILGREELREIRSNYKKGLGDLRDRYLYEDRKNTQLLNSYTRLQIALYHSSASRCASDLGVKVSHYCSAFESLFSTSQAELAHQLSERLSFFIGTTPKEKLMIYREIKKSYTARSKVVHGATIKENNLENLEKSSVFCDKLLRDSINKILKNEEIKKIFNGNNEKLNDYMISLIFGLEAKQT